MSRSRGDFTRHIRPSHRAPSYLVTRGVTNNDSMDTMEARLNLSGSSLVAKAMTQLCLGAEHDHR